MNNRYIRQQNIIEKDGQASLKKTKVLIVGAGGLGNLVSSFLVASGLINITIIDNDIIDITNLTRQICYHEEDCGQSKVETLKRHLECLNSEAIISINKDRLNKDNIDNFITINDLILGKFPVNLTSGISIFKFVTESGICV